MAETVTVKIINEVVRVVNRIEKGDQGDQGEAGPPGPGGVTEAPIDGKQYARKDAAWEEVAAGGGGAETLVAAFTTTGVETQVAFPGLSGNKYYRLEIDQAAAMAGNPVFSMRINGDASSAGYTTERSISFGAFVTLANNSDIINGFSGYEQWRTKIDLAADASGYQAASILFRADQTGGVASQLTYLTWKAGAFSGGITQIDIFSTSAMTAGMTFRLFEIKATP